MERARTNEDGRILWQKRGGGSLRLKGRIIKPGEKFRAFPHDIPKAFRDVVIPLEDVPGEIIVEGKVVAQEKPITVAPLTWELKPRGKSKYLFDVVDVKGKVINEKGLAKEIAEKLIKDLKR